MAELIIGDGCTRNSQHDADIFSSLCGNGIYILPLLDEMPATVIDNNTVRIGSGMALIEGRPVVINNGSYDTFSIPNGTEGVNRTYYLGYRIYTTSTGQNIEQYIGTSRPSVGSIRDGGSQMYLILYSIKLEGIYLKSKPMLLVEKLTPLSGRRADNRVISVVINELSIEPKLISRAELNSKLGTSYTKDDCMQRVALFGLNTHTEANASALVLGIKYDNVKDAYYVHFQTKLGSACRVTFGVLE